MKIQITVGDTVLTAVPEENSSAKALIALLQKGPITVQMSDYAGMEKVGSLGTNLPRNDTQISVDAGDVILYQGNQITIYYGTNSWNFTKLAVIEDATKESLLKVLGSGDVDVTFSIAE
ncbi:MAG: cyclophilin-like fold protein [Massiliimalia sp.]